MASNAVLLIDDNDDDALLFQRAVADVHGGVSLHVIADVSSGQNYLRGLDQYSDRSLWPMPRLIFLGLMLGERHGTEFLTWAKAHPRFKRIPIVAVSGTVSGAHANEILSLGANAVMAKAVDFNDFKQRVAMACELWLNFCIGPEFPPEGGTVHFQRDR